MSKRETRIDAEEGDATSEGVPRRRATLYLVGAAAVVAAANLGYVTLPVAVTLAQDERNSSVTVLARMGYYADPTVLTLDLWSVGETAPIDLTRILFQVAANRAEWPSVRNVTLSRRSRPVFVMPGDAFREMGELFAAGENPVYLMRTLPENLYHPNGEMAFGRWEGGLLGVLSEQMDDLNDFALAWALGEPGHRSGWPVP